MSLQRKDINTHHTRREIAVYSTGEIFQNRLAVVGRAPFAGACTEPRATGERGSPRSKLDCAHVTRGKSSWHRAVNGSSVFHG